MIDWIKVFDPEHVFELMAFLGFIGFGTWFVRDYFPWWKTFQEKKQELASAAEIKRIEAEAESDRRWQETAQQMSTNYADLKEELGKFNAMQRQFVDSIELLFRYTINGRTKDVQNDSGS